MDRNQRPHSRTKHVGSGSAHVGLGRKVSGSGGPVGFGGRNGGSGNRAGGTGGGGNGGYPQRGSGGRGMSLKTILIIGVIAVVAYMFLKGGFGGGSDILSGITESAGSFGGFSDLATTSSYTAPVSYSEPDYTVSDMARGKFVTPIGNGRDEVTVMVYMCGTDLESKYGMASKDLQEMINAKLSDKVHIVVETGGCSSWKNNMVSSSCNQIYEVVGGGLRTLEKNVGTAAMTDPDNLSEFITYCRKKYPADRNMLIFWDHGGGSLSGYGYDEKKPNASSMTLSKIDSALRKANMKFDFIGFDACLMATLETALVCENYADYLIGSEETEPGTGWYYTNWLSELSKDTSIPTVKLAKYIIDDFVSSCTASSGSANVTLSVVDLAELSGTLPESFRDFASSTNEMLRTDEYKTVSDARAGARQFSPKNKLNQVDLVDLADRIGTTESKELAEVIRSAVKYNKTTMSRCNGVSIYFPYETTSSVKSAVASYKDLGIDSEYTKCIQSFASLEYGGQIAASASQQEGMAFGTSSDMLGSLLSAFSGSQSSTSPVSSLLGSFSSGSSQSAGYGMDASSVLSLLSGFSGRSMPAAYGWVDTDLIADKAELIAENFIDPSHIRATEKGGRNVLSLSDDEWSLIQSVELNVFVRDGAGYIDLGLDNTFDFDDDGDLLLSYDGTWLTLNGHVCAYYMVSDTQKDEGSYVTIGRIPALLNGAFVNLQVIFDDEHEYGAVTGAYPMYDGETDVLAKGEIALEAGDTIELLCDYYDDNGNVSALYSLGERFTVPSGGFEIENLMIDEEDVSVAYRLTDIYGNHFWLTVE